MTFQLLYVAALPFSTAWLLHFFFKHVKGADLTDPIMWVSLGIMIPIGPFYMAAYVSVTFLKQLTRVPSWDSLIGK